MPPILSSFGSGSARGFGRGQVAVSLPPVLDFYNLPYLATADQVGLSTNNSGEVVSDQYGIGWRIAANWGFGGAGAPPNRWGGTNWKDASVIQSRKEEQNSGLIISMPKDSFFTDADNFSNQSGPGYSNWFTDRKADQAYPDVNDVITNKYDSFITLGGDINNPDNKGGAVYWRPPAGTSYVLVEFGAKHSDSPCSMVVWDNNIGDVHLGVKYAQHNSSALGTTDAINDVSSGVLVIAHKPEFIYINSDHQGTIAGSHYYLYV